MSPQMLAGYVGISRQAMLKVEKGAMNVDSARLIRLAHLQQCINDSMAVDLPAERVLLPGEIDERRREECLYQLMMLKRKLHVYEETIRKGMILLRSLELLQTVDEEEKLWKLKTKTTIIKKLDKYSEANCMRLRKRIYLLKAEADYVSTIVNDNSTYEKPTTI